MTEREPHLPPLPLPYFPSTLNLKAVMNINSLKKKKNQNNEEFFGDTSHENSYNISFFFFV